MGKFYVCFIIFIQLWLVFFMILYLTYFYNFVGQKIHIILCFWDYHHLLEYSVTSVVLPNKMAFMPFNCDNTKFSTFFGCSMPHIVNLCLFFILTLMYIFPNVSWYYRDCLKLTLLNWKRKYIISDKYFFFFFFQQLFWQQSWSRKQ